MDIDISKLIPLFFFVLIILWLIGFYLWRRILFLLKKNHLQEWEKLGSPTLFFNNSVKNNVTMLKYIRRKEYLNLNDSDLTIFCNIYRYFIVGYLIFFGLFVIVFLISLKYKF
jgi:hypothetical protein